MVNKKKPKHKPKKVRKARNKEYKIIVRIISDALIRIITKRTPRTFQQELHFISKTIQGFVDTTYIPKAIYTKDLLEQHFGYINLLEAERKKRAKKGEEDDVVEGIETAINILKGSRK